jgi:hypothetical protein
MIAGVRGARQRNLPLSYNGRRFAREKSKLQNVSFATGSKM